jgi:hypothetical protein
MVTDNVVIVQRNGVTARRSSQKLDGSSSTRELLAHCDTILRAHFFLLSRMHCAMSGKAALYQQISSFLKLREEQDANEPLHPREAPYP